MPFAQVGMGVGIDLRGMSIVWAGGCAAILALLALAVRLLFCRRAALALGLGVGACLMSPLAATATLLMSRIEPDLWPPGWHFPAFLAGSFVGACIAATSRWPRPA